MSQSNDNIFYHNNFIENADQVWFGTSFDNIWDIDWPDGGNYWSNHSNVDVKSGQYQMGSGSDGICDSPYSVDASNLDKYPCAGPVNYFEVEYTDPENIVVISNSSISDFQMNTTTKTVAFLAMGDTGIAFSRVDIPSSIASGLWLGDYEVLVNGVPVSFGNWTVGSKTYIYFSYEHSTKEVVIIPEFSSLIMLSLFMIAAFSVALVCKRKRSN